jgi:hypothetical protein
MIVIEVEAIKPERDQEHLDSDELGSALVFDVANIEDVVVQLVNGEGLSAWPTSLVVTLQCSLDFSAWSDFPSGAVTYNGFGVKASVNVSGLSAVRVVVTTVSSGGHGNVAVRVNGVKNVE